MVRRASRAVQKNSNPIATRSRRQRAVLRRGGWQTKLHAAYPATPHAALAKHYSPVPALGISSSVLVTRSGVTAGAYVRKRLGLRQLVRTYKRQRKVFDRRYRRQSYASAAIRKHYHLRAVRGYACLDPRLGPLSTGTRLDTLDSRVG